MTGETAVAIILKLPKKLRKPPEPAKLPEQWIIIYSQEEDEE